MLIFDYLLKTLAVLGIWFEEDLPEAVQQLKWKLERTSGSIQAFFYPDQVLAALSMVPAIKELLQHSSNVYAVVQEIVALAEAYARLNPQDQAPEPRTPLRCWLYLASTNCDRDASGAGITGDLASACSNAAGDFGIFS
jgi:hypothetical protein